ncbi:uncharacterized protein BX663DRAFT_487118 [Cokeromyces recurvatus]|uniref:uncharacterized protein n=1 Tax=Cokeromyces recurvatus TaxID=90255 RepID=UPI002221032C|nr:uncharacterized protein BX663DRAFT_487118 [Cokeromyces recurvatus]KAI7901830.1 hypothetical protein BX663DRAFT_487118 [Cokeromyces recurvatus]
MSKRRRNNKRNKKDERNYIEISDDDDDDNQSIDYDHISIDSTLPSSPSSSSDQHQPETNTESSHVHFTEDMIPESDREEDFISLNTEVNTRSRQEKRRDERAELKRKREDSNEENKSDDIDICYPWMNLMSYYRIKQPLSARKLLQHEVACFLQYIEPTEIEIKLREYLIHRIRTAIQANIPEAKVTVFGSYSTQLYLPNSDIDLVVQFPPSVQVRLRRIAHILESEEICREPHIIEQATVPVIKLQDIMTKLKVDIILNSTSGVDSARRINKFVKKYPAVRPLTLIVKYLLSLRQLNEVYTGGLGGYAIVCLVVSFLQMHPKVASKAIDPMQNISSLLLDFFQLYGIMFNVDQVGIDVNGNGSYYDKSGIVCRNGRTVFSIHDPEDPSNDIGIKSYNAIAIIRTFRYAYVSMTRKAFILEEELEENNYKKLYRETIENPKSGSILSSFLYISAEFINQRQLMNDVYDEKRWEGQTAAKTFSF